MVSNRWHAHNALRRDGSIAVDCAMASASRRSVIRYRPMLSHGVARCGPDYAKAYATAVRNGLVAQSDVDGVRDLLRCSTRTAYMT